MSFHSAEYLPAVEKPDNRAPYILVAPNGARRHQADHPEVPISIEATIQTAKASHAAGAQGLHLHIRDEMGAHSLDPGRYREALTELRRQIPGMDLQITTEAAGRFLVADQLTCLREVRPEWASISVREVSRRPDLLDQIYGLCDAQGTRVQHILYDAEDARLLSEWQIRGIVRPDQTEQLLVLGRYNAGMNSSPDMLDGFPGPPGRWLVCALGSMEHSCLHEAARRGGDVRVGFENSLTDGDGNRWTDNAASVAALVAAIEGGVK